MIADMTSAVQHAYSVDSHRVYAAGFSAGGAMANVMGATYPDMFAAIGSGSGCEYNGLPCVGGVGPDPSSTGKQAYAAMGSHARVMPAIVFQGDADSIVAPANGPAIVKEWQVTDDYADDGSLNSSIPTQSTNVTSGAVQGGRSYTVTTYGDGKGNAPVATYGYGNGLFGNGNTPNANDPNANDPNAKDLIEFWSVQGMNHAWSGGSSTEQYADPSGPNETNAMYAFFTNHPMP